MVSVQSNDVDCPFCGYSKATYELQCRTNEEWLFCTRCGSSVNVLICNFPKEKDYGGRLIFPEGWKPKLKRVEERSSHIMRLKVKNQCEALGGIKHRKICDFKKEVKERLLRGEELVKAEYTFKRSREWFIKDLLLDKTFKFEDEYY